MEFEWLVTEKIKNYFPPLEKVQAPYPITNFLVPPSHRVCSTLFLSHLGQGKCGFDPGEVVLLVGFQGFAVSLL